MIVCCVAGGPSYSEDQAALVNAAHAAGKCHVLVVNRGWERHPDADVLYAPDARWWEAKEYGQRALAEFRGEMWTCNAAIARKFGICEIELESGAQGLGRGRTDPTVIGHGGNGGYQLICKAFRFLRLVEPIEDGPIVLVGYDLQHTGGRAHHHADYTDQTIDGRKVHFTNASGVKGWLPHFTALAADLKREGMRVVNCSTATALMCFERGDLAAVLA